LKVLEHARLQCTNRAASPRALSPRSILPDYAGALLAYHARLPRSHVPTLKAVRPRLLLAAGQRTLVVATGDDTYALLFSASG
jgi:hypothetical protein